MPEGDVRILGADTHISRKSFPLVAGAGILVVVLALRARAQAATSNTGSTQQPYQGTDPNSQLAAEFYSAQQQAAQQIAQLTAMNALEQQQVNDAYQLAAGLNPGLQTQCINWSQWYALGSDVRNGLTNQVNQGQLYATPSTNGYCFAPSQMGIMGHPPLVTQRVNQGGLFGGSTSTTGYPTTVGAAPQLPQPTNWFQAIFG